MREDNIAESIYLNAVSLIVYLRHCILQGVTLGVKDRSVGL